MPYTGTKLIRYYSWKNLRFRDRANISPDWGDFEKYLADTGYPDVGFYMVRLDKKQPWGPTNFEWKERTHCSIKESGNKEYQKGYKKHDPDYHRDKYYRRKYGISLVQYNEMLRQQGEKCLICSQHETQKEHDKVRRLAVDHCHASKKVRGLLCNNCNARLGHSDDSVRLLCYTILYLDKHYDLPLIEEAIAILQAAL